MPDLPTLGPRAAVDLLHTYAGIDFSRVLNFQNRQGLTGQQILQQAYAAIGGVNQALINKYVLYVTEDALTWGLLWPRDARQSDVDADLQSMIERWQNRVEDDIWTRAFVSTEFPQGTGYDVGRAIGSGMNVAYIPTAYSGVTFISSHTHYLYQVGNSSANAQTLIETMVKEMRHHGHTGTPSAFVSESDVDIYAGMSKFVALQLSGSMIVPGAGATAVQVASGTPTGMPGELFGYVNTSRGIVELRYYSRIPAGYIFMSKSYGQNSPLNGLALRVHPDTPFGLMPVPILSRTLTPEMEMIQLKATHGVGVNKRLNGVAGYFATGASQYVNPSFAN